MRYLIIFSYDGSKFHGLERQKDVKSVQKTLEDTLSFFLKENIVIKASGRTDALVHALNQTAHFDTSKKLPSFFQNKLNNVLMPDIKIKSLKKVNDNFHARFNVKWKIYTYKIKLNHKSDAYYFGTFYDLNLNNIKKACKLFLGCHNFQNFVSGKRDNYETYIKSIKIRKRNNIITFTFVGTGFYRYMVRHLVGALYDVGRGKTNELVLKEMLKKPDVSKQLTVMPAFGLYLVKVKY